MTTRLHVSPADLGATASHAYTTPATFAGATGPVGPRVVPLMIPEAQLYFWSRKWQDQEREFERDRDAGRLLKADSMLEVMRDLMRVRDDD